MGKSLTTTSTAMILGALTGGAILGTLGGKGLNSFFAGALTGGTSATVANTLSLLIKTNNNITGCLKTTILIPISAAFTLFAFAFILDAKPSNFREKGADLGWFYLAYMLIGAINTVAATAGVVGASIFHREPSLTIDPNWLINTEDLSTHKVNNEQSTEIGVNKLKLN